MAEYTANAIQLVTANSNVLFTDTPVYGNCSISHRSGSGLVNLRGLTNQSRARFQVSYSANIAVPTGGTAGPISLALAIDGETLAATTGIATASAVGAYNNVASGTFIDVPNGCCLTISLKNTSDASINVQNANLIVTRVA